MLLEFLLVVTSGKKGGSSGLEETQGSVSGVLVMVYILICAVVTYECLFCEKALGCMLMICAFSACMPYFT